MAHMYASESQTSMFLNSESLLLTRPGSVPRPPTAFYLWLEYPRWGLQTPSKGTEKVLVYGH